MKECGPSPKGEEYCACGCAAYDNERCGRKDCPHGSLCKLIAESNEAARLNE
jgi:hypothetical protein